ncbi:MAG: hypothetical protein IJM18_02185 [Clostridia bacterium]|nr:hypothetical protein [Clostridia bacterium]
MCTALLAALLTALFCGCEKLDLQYRGIPSGFIGSEEHMDEEGFRQYTDYCKYYYPGPEKFVKNKRYKPVSEVGTETVKGYFDDMETRLQAFGRLEEYDFDPAMISEDDLVRIVTKEGEPVGCSGRYEEYANYDVWLFDTETNTLYYIHNN